MTPTTQVAAMQELKLDESALAERTARAEAMANGEAKTFHGRPVQEVNDDTADVIAEMIMNHKPRKRRSDAGKPKPPRPAPAQSDALDDLDAAVLRMMQTAEALRKAEAEHGAAVDNYGRILGALKGK